MHSDSKSRISFFLIFEYILCSFPWIMLAIAIILCVVEKHGVWHDLALSYFSGMVVYILTVVIPNWVSNVKLKRHIVNDLARLYNAYKDLLWTISAKTPGKTPVSLEQVQLGLERFNCARGGDCICLSKNTIDILRPKCTKILGITSLLITRHYAFSVEELLVIHEITQVWFLKYISAIEPGGKYILGRAQMMNNAEFLVRRYNDLQKTYFEIKRKANRTVGWHPA